ncbi:MAG: UTP--glucose-1-phosphate uridylyltransferase GalU [Methanocorpusculum sp.]|jgi:UTP--glucose-1-phosphate uridylyltransferase|nr:UTP--glucose-1-phosphate uridylyltransferase GalU [Methanocorpusculum sp.]HJJ67798.1 UTP--glucose-1-phosphate uridylyltransferase GalU [Methanocorpusculum sp.]
MEKVTKAVIPAAGFGTRFFPITKAMPKEMVPVVDKPVIQYVVEEAVASGCDDILIITGRNKRAIEDHFDVSAELNMHLQNSGNTELLEASERLSDLADIHYIRQKEQRGLGDAVLCAKQHIGDEPFAVLLGDTICLPDTGEKPCTAQLADVYCKTALPVIGVEEVPEHKIKDYGIIDGVLLEERLYDIIDIIEKPSPEEAPSNIGAMGRYLLTSDIFEILEHTIPGRKGEIQLTDALREYEKMLGLVSKSVRYDVGDIETWIVSNLKLLMMDERYREIVTNILMSG